MRIIGHLNLEALLKYIRIRAEEPVKRKYKLVQNLIWKAAQLKQRLKIPTRELSKSNHKEMETSKIGYRDDDWLNASTDQTSIKNKKPIQKRIHQLNSVQQKKKWKWLLLIGTY